MTGQQHCITLPAGKYRLQFVSANSCVVRGDGGEQWQMVAVDGRLVALATVPGQPIRTAEVADREGREVLQQLGAL